MLQNMGESLISFEKHITTMFTSGSKITAVARNTFIDWKIKADEETPEGEPSPSKVHVVKKLEDASGRDSGSDAEAEEAVADNTKMIKSATEKAAAEAKSEAQSEAEAAVEAAKGKAAAAEAKAAAAEEKTEAAEKKAAVAEEKAAATEKKLAVVLAEAVAVSAAAEERAAASQQCLLQ